MWPWAKNEDKLDQLQKTVNDHIADEDNSYSRLEKTLEKIDGRLDNIDVTLGKQQVILDEHIKRTAILESKVEQDATHAKQLSWTLRVLKWATIVTVGLGSGIGVAELAKWLMGG